MKLFGNSEEFEVRSALRGGGGSLIRGWRGFCPQGPEDGNGSGAGAGAGKKDAVEEEFEEPETPDPKDAENARLKKALQDRQKGEADTKKAFDEYKRQVEREKMSAEEKLKAERDDAQKAQKAAEAERDAAKLEAQKTKFGADLSRLGGLISLRYVDTLWAERQEGETVKEFLARIKTDEEFAPLFRSRSDGGSGKEKVPAPKVPGGSKGKRPEPDDEIDDEDEDHLAQAFRDDPVKLKAAREELERRMKKGAKS